LDLSLFDRACPFVAQEDGAMDVLTVNVIVPKMYPDPDSARPYLEFLIKRVQNMHGQDTVGDILP
jgi:hypothetical protein